MYLLNTSPPGIEPLTLAEAKLHARIDIGFDDSLTSKFIVDARRYVEKYCKIALITQPWSLFLDYSDNNWFDLRNRLYLPLNPIQSITTITTFDNTDSGNVFDASNYRLSGSNNSRVVLNNNIYWPDNLRSIDAMRIDFVAGFGDTAATVPDDIIQAIRMLVAYFYQMREAAADPSATNQNQVGGNIPFSVTSLLSPYRTLTIG